MKIPHISRRSLRRRKAMLASIVDWTVYVVLAAICMVLAGVIGWMLATGVQSIG